MESKLISKPTHIQITLNLAEAEILLLWIKKGLKSCSYGSTPESYAFEKAIKEFEQASNA